jgi:catechol 2,3-dioxygenase-like lactoylglutathione lyase family enzyme
VDVIEGFDHLTVVVDDIDEGRRFFGLLGFAEAADVTVGGPEMAAYMGIPDWKAEHLTLRMQVEGHPQEVQLLHFHEPEPTPDPFGGSLARIGFNHVCFRVTDLDEVIGRLGAAGYRPRNEIMAFHDRRLVFVDGPGGIVVEFAEWTT